MLRGLCVLLLQLQVLRSRGQLVVVAGERQTGNVSTKRKMFGGSGLPPIDGGVSDSDPCWHFAFCFCCSCLDNIAIGITHRQLLGGLCRHQQYGVSMHAPALFKWDRGVMKHGLRASPHASTASERWCSPMAVRFEQLVYRQDAHATALCICIWLHMYGQSCMNDLHVAISVLSSCKLGPSTMFKLASSDSLVKQAWFVTGTCTSCYVSCQQGPALAAHAPGSHGRGDTRAILGGSVGVTLQPAPLSSPEQG